MAGEAFIVEAVVTRNVYENKNDISYNLTEAVSDGLANALYMAIASDNGQADGFNSCGNEVWQRVFEKRQLSEFLGNFFTSRLWLYNQHENDISALAKLVKQFDENNKYCVLIGELNRVKPVVQKLCTTDDVVDKSIPMAQPKSTTPLQPTVTSQQPINTYTLPTKQETIPVANRIDRFCTSCGNKVPKDMRFCQRCGTEVEFVSAVPAYNEYLTVAPTPSAETMYTSVATKQSAQNASSPYRPETVYNTEMTNRFCTACGAEIPQGMRFCTVCGQTVDVITQSQQDHIAEIFKGSRQNIIVMLSKIFAGLGVIMLFVPFLSGELYPDDRWVRCSAFELISVSTSRMDFDGIITFFPTVATVFGTLLLLLFSFIKKIPIVLKIVLAIITLLCAFVIAIWYMVFNNWGNALAAGFYFFTIFLICHTVTIIMLFKCRKDKCEKITESQTASASIKRQISSNGKSPVSVGKTLVASALNNKPKTLITLGCVVATIILLIVLFSGGRPSGTYIYRDWTGERHTIVFRGSNFTHTWPGGGQVEGGRYELNGSELILIYTWGYNEGWESSGRYNKSEETIHIGNNVYRKSLR